LGLRRAVATPGDVYLREVLGNARYRYSRRQPSSSRRKMTPLDHFLMGVMAAIGAALVLGAMF
jgi:hypothetical protein